MPLTGARPAAVLLPVLAVLVAFPSTPAAFPPEAPAPMAVAQAMDPPLELTVRTHKGTYDPGEPVRLVLILANRGPARVTLEFSDAQRYDFRIHDEEGEPLWRWGADVAFPQVLGELTVPPGDSALWRETFVGRLPEGAYTAEGIVPARERRLRAETTFRVR